jgi:hypothetical protein
MLREPPRPATVRRRSERAFERLCYRAPPRGIAGTSVPLRAVANGRHHRPRRSRHGTSPRLEAQPKALPRAHRCVRAPRPEDVMTTMKSKKLLAICGACATAGAPATAALAASGGGVTDVAASSPLAARTAIASSLHDHAQLHAERHVLKLARSRARLKGIRVRPSYVQRVSSWSLPRLLDERRTLRREVRHLRRTGGAPAVAIPSVLASIAACESGGDPRAVGGGGAFRGKYQFDYGTWASVGGRGDPAAAPTLEQDRRAAMLYARAGAAPWPVCGR